MMRFVILSFMALTAVAAISTATDSAQPYKVTFHLENLERGGTGRIVVEVHPEWAPFGAQRFAELLEQGFFNDNRFFRVVCGFVTQFGIPADPQVSAAWRGKTIPDDPQLFHVPNNRGRMSFFTEGKDDRSTQMIINVKDNDYLDEQGYVPFAEVIEGMFFIDRVYNKYGGAARAPDPIRLEYEGNVYVDKDFPLLTHIKKVEIAKPVMGKATSQKLSWHLPTLGVALGAFITVTILGRGYFLHAGNSPTKSVTAEP